ncbi:MAG: ParB N-terminal domain-containing protein [Coriobacteriia bacterium]|nr:ParB N-terminal domain-containing protein [Coriobacteriia bacterium]
MTAELPKRTRKGLDGFGKNASPEQREARQRAAHEAVMPFLVQGRDNVAAELRIDEIEPSPNNFFAMEDIDALAADIAEVGLLHPLVVRPLSEDPLTHYELISGERRWRALRTLVDAGDKRFERVGVMIRRITDDQAEHALISANMEARDLTVAVRIEAIARMRVIVGRERAAGTVEGKTADLLATRLGMAPRQIKRYEAIAKADVGIIEAVDAGTITLRSGVALAGRPADVQARALTELTAAEKKHTEDEAAEVIERAARPHVERHPAAGPSEKAVKALRGAVRALERIQPFTLDVEYRDEALALAERVLDLVRPMEDGQ